jgi:hypothetical protein
MARAPPDCLGTQLIDEGRENLRMRGAIGLERDKSSMVFDVTGDFLLKFFGGRSTFKRDLEVHGI